MREIKFRAYWPERNQENGSYYKDDRHCMYHNIREFWAKNVMQHTGLKDKNGKEIYENDIVLHHRRVDDHEVHYNIALIVQWSDRDACWTLKNENKLSPIISGIHSNHRLEVIGNIYENPELIEDIK